MLHYYPSKHVSHPPVLDEAEADERMDSQDYKDNNRKKKNKKKKCWYSCLTCGSSENDDSNGHDQSTRSHSDRDTNHPGHSSPQDISHGSYEPHYESHNRSYPPPSHDVCSAPWRIDAQRYPRYDSYSQSHDSYHASSQSRAQMPQHHDTTLQSRAQMPQHHDAPLQSRASMPQRQDTSPQSRAQMPQRHDTSPQSYAQMPQRQDTSPQSRAQRPQRHDTSPQSYAQMPQHHDTSPQSRASMPQRQDTSPQSRAQMPQRQDTSPQSRAQRPQRQDTSPQSRAQMPQRHRAPPQNRASMPPFHFAGQPLMTTHVEYGNHEGKGEDGRNWPERRQNEVHDSPTREDSSILRRNVGVKSEFVPKGQMPTDNYPDERSLPLRHDISALRPLSYAQEVSSDAKTLPEPREATQDLRRRGYQSVQSIQPFLPHNFETMPIRSRVRFVGKNGKFVGGTVAWTGFRSNDFSVHLTVIRLDECASFAENGIFQNQKLVNPVEENRYLLMNEKDLLLFSLIEGDYCRVIYGPKEATNCKGFLRNRSQKHTYQLHPVDTLYTERLANIRSFPDYFLEKIATPVTDDVSSDIGPITLREFNEFLGRNKGIQGKKNSCYLDTLLFSVFAFSADLDDFLFNNHSMVASHLRHSIVLPLRACHFVADAQVEYLRRVLSEETNNKKFETEARDIPECLDALFGSVLRVPPPLHVGFDNFFNPTFAIETLSKPDNVRIPTFEDFLYHSSVVMACCFQEVPKYFFLQLPRQAYHSSIVIPSLEMELNPILYRSVKECASCQRNAALQFSQLAEKSGLASSFLCRSCAQNQGLDVEGARQLPETAVPDGEEPDSRLVLTAVLCIERSHYNCFARCEDRWVFFDSMSDQEEQFDPVLGEKVTFNIPVVRSVPNFEDIINRASESLKKHGSLDTFLADLREEHLVRLFKCAYIAIYSQRHSSASICEDNLRAQD